MICLACGRSYVEANAGCYVDELCADCTPSAGRCLDCLAERREAMSERMRRLSPKARDWA